MDESDRKKLEYAIEIALQAEQEGNLPIGAVISYKERIIGEGGNSIWSPKLALSRHAEMQAMASVEEHYWQHAGEMTLYTTLEPCLMCAGAILLHGIGKVVFGSVDPYGGAGPVMGCLPPFFAERFSWSVWMGPVMPDVCDPLYQRARMLEKKRATGEDYQ